MGIQGRESPLGSGSLSQVEAQEGGQSSKESTVLWEDITCSRAGRWQSLWSESLIVFQYAGIQVGTNTKNLHTY